MDYFIGLFKHLKGKVSEDFYDVLIGLCKKSSNFKNVVEQWILHSDLPKLLRECHSFKKKCVSVFAEMDYGAIQTKCRQDIDAKLVSVTDPSHFQNFGLDPFIESLRIFFVEVRDVFQLVVDFFTILYPHMNEITFFTRMRIAGSTEESTEGSISIFHLEQVTLCYKFIEFVELVVTTSEIEDSSIFQEFIHDRDMNDFADLKIIILLFQNAIPSDDEDILHN